LEILRVDVRLVGFLGVEPFDEDELVGIVDVARPLAKDVARRVPGGLCEVVDQREQTVGSRIASALP
jgi:hypothetical protein